jgi:hypothetical protein
MMHHSTTGKGRAVATLATAVFLCGIAGTWPAAAQDRGPAFGGPDSQHGYRRYSVGPDERRSDLDRLGHKEFERGYRAGREDERLRHDRSGAPERSAGPGWNDSWQSEPRERLERAAARLREALVLMQRQPSGRRLDEALEQARQALIRVQNAMTWLPRASSDTGGDEDQRRYERHSGQGIGAYRASGGWRS